VALALAVLYPILAVMGAGPLESLQLMIRDEMNAFAAAWVAAWNARDVERVLSLFSDDIRFTSPTALVFLEPRTGGRQRPSPIWCVTDAIELTPAAWAGYDGCIVGHHLVALILR